MENNTFLTLASNSLMQKILDDQDLVVSQKLFSEMFGAITGISAIINKNRQIVYANNDFLGLLGLQTIEPVLGKRFGEVVSCLQFGEESAGCGSSENCQYCGAVNTILESQLTNKKSIRETSISSFINGKHKSLDLKITSTPITLANQVFYVISLQDISDKKKLQALERIFLHDLLNTASGLSGLLSLLKAGTDTENNLEIINMSEQANQNIIDEIMLYKQLKAAENGDIQVNIDSVNTMEFLESVIDGIKFHEVGKNKNITIADSSYNFNFQTDRILLQRIITNLIKNAFEAIPEGGSVITGIEDKGDKIRFWVKNPGVIPYDYQNQIFNRSFSSKGIGRGTGTYSVRLLTENYLNGKVSFVSNEYDGTIFKVTLYKIWLK